MEGPIHTYHEQEHHDQVEDIAEEERAREPLHDDWLNIVMEEYRTLRREIIASLAMQQPPLTLGTLAIGGLTLAGFHEWSDETSSLPLIVFLVVVPLVSYVTVFVWLGEYARSMRAGAFLVGIEDKVNKHLRRDALTWEHYLRQPQSGHTPQFAWNSIAIFVFFLAAIPATAVVVANVSAFGLGLTLWQRVPIDIAEAALFVLVAAYLFHALCVAFESAGADVPRWLRRGSKSRSVAPQLVDEVEDVARTAKERANLGSG